jgi:hypothetical protein
MWDQVDFRCELVTATGAQSDRKIEVGQICRSGNDAELIDGGGLLVRTRARTLHPGQKPLRWRAA